MVTKARQLAEFIANADVDSDEIATGAVTTSKLADTLDFSSKTMVMADNQLSGDKIHGGTVSAFASTGIDDNASATALTITSGGGVGIGTDTVADAKLEISGGGIDIQDSGYPRVRFYVGSTFKGGVEAVQNAGSMISTSAVNDLAIRSQSNMLFAAGGNTESMRIDASGYVGIGTTDPQRKLHIVENSMQLRINRADGADDTWEFYSWNDGLNIYPVDAASTVWFGRDGQNTDVSLYNGRLAVNHAGALPTGYAIYANGSIWAKAGAGDSGGLRLHSNSGINVSANVMSFHTGQASGFSFNGNSDGADGSNPLTVILANGNVGIGKTDPSAKLHTVKATSDTITAATAGVKFDGSGSDGLAFGNIASAPHSSWIQAGYLANGHSPAFNSGYPIALNPIGGNVGIGITNPSEELHIYDAGSDPYVLVDGSGGNRDSGYKINAGNGVKIAARADTAGNMYFADNAIAVTASNGNGQHRSVKIDSEIVLRENSGTNPSQAIIARMLGCRDIAGAGGSAILGGQGDTLSGHALRKNGSTGTNTFFFGPYGTFPAGSFTALFRIKIGLINSGSIGQIDVVGSGCADASGPNVTNRSRSVNTSDFINGQYMYFPIDFDRTSSGGGIEFRWLNANSNADVYLDHILIVPRITR
jgi:hypothetical protein